jgi:hypothetical protein
MARLRYNNAGGTLGAPLTAFSGIAIDGSTPAMVTTPQQVSGTIGPFTPPAGSLLVLFTGGPGPPAIASYNVSSITDTLGAHLTWRRLGQQQRVNYTDTEIWVADAPSPATSFSITVTYAQSVFMYITVLVLTGARAAASQTGAVGGGNQGPNPFPAYGVTTTAPGSWVFGTLCMSSGSANGPPTIGSGQTDVFNGNTMLANAWSDAAKMGWVQAPTAPTPASGTVVNITDTGIATFGGSGVVAEILAGTSTTSSITFTSAPAFSTLVAPDYIPLVLEPPSGVTPSTNFEVAYLTGYTSGATTGTITRGQEGTSAVAHANGSNWTVAPLVADFPGVPPSRANRTAALTLTAAAYNKIPVDTIVFDTGSYFDVATNHRYNCPVAGYYAVSAEVQVNAASGDSLIVLYKNGTEVSVGTRRNGTQAADSYTLSDIVSCAAGDYLELYFYATNGVALATGGSTWINYMAVSLAYRL